MSHNCHFAEDRAEIEGECTVKDMIHIHKFLIEMAEANMNMESVTPIAHVFGLELPEVLSNEEQLEINELNQ